MSLKYVPNGPFIHQSVWAQHSGVSHQAFIWTNDYPFHWLNVVSLGRNELKKGNNIMKSFKIGSNHNQITAGMPEEMWTLS